MALGCSIWYNCHRGGLVSIAALCIAHLWKLGSASAELLVTPSLRWSFSLEGGTVDDFGLSGRSLRQGNAVVTSRGGDKLFVTADDGSLHIINIAGAKPTTSTIFEPDLVSDTLTECHSGVVAVERTTNDGTALAYLVYAVIDTPVSSVEVEGSQPVGSDNRSQTNSRVIAINMDGSLRWSVAIEGIIVGTPIIGSSGRLIYVSHNVNATKGFLSVILSKEQGTVAELTASLSPDGRDAPLGPPALQQTLEGIPGSDVDLVVVAESWDDGFGGLGSIYLLSPTIDFEDTGGKGSSSYQLSIISQNAWRFASVMAPLFVGSSLWIGGIGATIAGWTDNRDLTNVLDGTETDVDPQWLFRLDVNVQNASQPLSITPEISPDGSQLYIAGASNDFYCMGSDNGRLLWSTSIDSAILNRPTVFSNTNVANVIYFIESMDGRVRQFDIDTASENWQFSCVDVTGLDSCQNSVEAEFSVSESGNVLYYGDIFGRISALEVGTFDTEAPTARPSLSPTVTPSAAPNLSASPTKTNAAMVTTVPTALPTAISTAPPTLLPVVILGPSVFDNANSALGAENEDDEKTDALSLGLIVGVAVAGIIVALLVVFFVARILLRPKKKLRTKETRVKIDDLDGDVEADLESSGEDDSDGADSDDMDDITVTSGSDSVEVEVSAGSQPFQTPIKKSRSRKKRKKIRTPPTATTLASIQEAEDEEIAALPHEDDPKADLSEKFRLVQNTITPVEKGNAGRCSDGHVELAVGLNNLRPLADDMSAGSDDDSVPPPPPPGLEGLFHDHSDIEEEKKDVDFIDGEYLGNLSPQPSFGMTTDSQPPHSPTQSTASARSFISSVAAALTRSPKNSNEPPALSPASSAASTTDQASSEANAEGAPSISMSPSMMSTDSSLYTDDKSRVSTDKLSPLSTGIFGGNDQASLPDDEASAMLQPTLYHKYKARDEAALPARVPGAHYLTKGSPLRPKFTPSGSTKVPKVKSARTKRNLNGFSSSFLQSEGSADEDGNEARISSKAHAEDPRRAPTFKRRSKREETAPKASNMIEDTWNSFLNDLAVAEQQFFSPTHSQKSAVLRYSVDDDDTTLSAPIDDDAATVRTGSA